jgi:hypothetical protein
MTRLVLGLAAVLAACGSGKPPSSSPIPTRQCSNASCCGGGWHWLFMTGCIEVAPPYCGCYCSGPEPTVYATEEECRVAHPPRRRAAS